MIVVLSEAITLGITWVVIFFVVYVLVAYKLGFGVRGVVAGIYTSPLFLRTLQR